MLLNGSNTLRKPSVVDDSEVQGLVDFVKSSIKTYLAKGHRSFTAKDLFGYTHFDWRDHNYPIQILFDRWYQKVEQRDAAKYNLSEAEICDAAFKNAGQAVGYIIKMAIVQLPEKFRCTTEFKTTRYTLV